MTSNGPIELEARRDALNAVLESKEFSRSPALARLLKYLCEKTFEGKIHEIKEFSIATELYGRQQDFADKRDSVVRVEVSRLRKRLLHLYEEEGVGHPVRILIRAGTYQPEFERAASDPPVPLAVPMPMPSLVLQPIAKPLFARYALFSGLGLLLLLGVGFIVFPRAVPGKQPAAVSLQPAPVRAIGDTQQPVRILAGSSTERSVDRFGAEWLGDRYFNGGDQNRWEIAGKEMGVPNRAIRGAPDQLMFRTFRFGAFSY